MIICRNKNEVISDVLLWTPSQGRASVKRSTRTYLQQLYTDTGCSLEDLPEAMDNRNEWRKRVREFHASTRPNSKYLLAGHGWGYVMMMMMVVVRDFFKKFVYWLS